MPKANVLDRVAADLANGFTQPAIQRLGSLVAAHPTDLDLRKRLASVHRLVGNGVEAGRWDYLSADADPVEVAAFERAYPSPAARLRKLRWPRRDGHAATEFARGRLAELVEAAIDRPAGADAGTVTGALARAEALGTGRISVRDPAAAPPRIRRPRRRYAIAVGVIAVPFAVLGAVTVVQWIVG
jgi:hypothetical protein